MDSSASALTADATSVESVTTMADQTVNEHGGIDLWSTTPPPFAPFGGFKMSGNGKQGGRAGLEESKT
jgi:acyl-CoA reductase-like NAD-dependent aldehyde dehydrogenase